MTGIRYSFAHTWEYCEAIYSHSDRPSFLYEVETSAGRFICPLVERTFRGITDVVTPHGFSGFVGEGDSGELDEHWRRSAFERGYVSGYLVNNPALAGTGRPFLSGETFHDKSIYVWDLSPSLQRLYAGLHPSRRSELRHWNKLAASLVTHKSRVAAFFIDNYEEFFRRKHATSTYGLSAWSIASLAALDNIFLVGFEQDGHLTAASMFGYTPGGGDYLFNISKPEGRRYSAALVWAGAVHLKSLGIPQLNLGGGLADGDGVAAFKSRFGAAKAPLPVVKQVYDRPRYLELCRRVGVHPDQLGGYFPAYRQGPMTTSASVSR